MFNQEKAARRTKTVLSTLKSFITCFCLVVFIVLNTSNITNHHKGKRYFPFFSVFCSSSLANR